MRYAAICGLFLATAFGAPAPDAEPEYALVIPRAALVAEIDKVEAMAFLIAYGAGEQSYAAGFAAGQIYHAKKQLALLDYIVSKAAIDK